MRSTQTKELLTIMERIILCSKALNHIVLFTSKLLPPNVDRQKKHRVNGTALTVCQLDRQTDVQTTWLTGKFVWQLVMDVGWPTVTICMCDNCCRQQQQQQQQIASTLNCHWHGNKSSHRRQKKKKTEERDTCKRSWKAKGERWMLGWCSSSGNCCWWVRWQHNSNSNS